jgi:hypothetical protein
MLRSIGAARYQLACHVVQHAVAHVDGVGQADQAPAVPRWCEKCWNIRSRATQELAYSPDGGVNGADSAAPGPATSTNG